MESTIQKVVKKDLELDVPTFELLPESGCTNDDQYDGGFHVSRKAAPVRKAFDGIVDSRSKLQKFTFN